MKVKSIILMLVIFMLALPVWAQEQEKTCTPEEWAANQQPLIDIVNTLGTADDPTYVLLLIDAAVEAIRGSCTGGEWTSEDYGSNAVIGPVVFGGTLYQGEFTAGSFSSVIITPLEGNCDQYNLLSVAELKGGTSQTLYKFENCVAFFEVKSSSTWTLNVQKLK